MNLFKRKPKTSPATTGSFISSAPNSFSGVGVISSGAAPIAPSGAPNGTIAGHPLSELVLATIHDGVIITDRAGLIKYINPAAVAMTECGSAEDALGLDFALLLKIESIEGRELENAENLLAVAIQTGRPLDPTPVCLVSSRSGKRIPVSLSVLPAENGNSKIITFRNIAKELAEEGEQAEFVSTASHEMRTPVASIEGYLGLALNPQTATIDERARGYLTAAHAAAQHLGHLFHDLLDATKLSDGHVRPKFEPVEMVGLVKQIADAHLPAARTSRINFQFGSKSSSMVSDIRRLDQVVYASVDVNFLREILDNIIDNAIKYTPSGGSIYINVLGDGDRALINVTDTGMGISSEDLPHIFQKFYRADNSKTRTIGGTGLGLYLVKQRTEAMGGRVWAESAFGEGTTFYVSLPRLTGDEYEKRLIAAANQKMISQDSPPPQTSIPTPVPPQTPSRAPSPVPPQTPPQIPAPPQTPPPAANSPQVLSTNQTITTNGGTQ